MLDEFWVVNTGYSQANTEENKSEEFYETTEFAIIASVVGCLLFIGIIVVIIYCCHKNKTIKSNVYTTSTQNMVYKHNPNTTQTVAGESHRVVPNYVN